MSFLRPTLNDSHSRSVKKAQEKSIKTESHCRHVHRNATSGTLTVSPTISQVPTFLVPYLTQFSPGNLQAVFNPHPVAPSQTQVTFNEKTASRTTPKIDTQARSSVTDLLGLPHEFYLCTRIIPLYSASRSSPQALPRLPEDKELRTPPSLGTNRLSGSLDTTPFTQNQLTH